MTCEKNIVFELKVVSNLIKRRVDEIVSKNYDYKVTHVHGLISRYLYENRDKDIFQKDIEERFCIRRSTVTSILNLMEKNDMIIRESVAKDARLKKIILTKKSLDIHNIVFLQISSIEKDIFKGLSSEEIDTFYKILDKIKSNIIF